MPANRVLEDPPGFLPVILCYKINGQWLTGQRGGPVRMVVPEAYGFKSVKWIQRVVVTSKYQPEDTYALQNNDVNDSWLKTRALFGVSVGASNRPHMGAWPVGTPGVGRPHCFSLQVPVTQWCRALEREAMLG